MHDEMKPGKRPEYDTAEGLSLAVSYLDDPSAVDCPRCGPGRIQVVAYLDPVALAEGRQEPALPEGDYTVILYCHGCRQGAALSFGPATTGEDRRAA